MAEAETSQPRLSEIFDKAFELFEDLDTTSLETNSREYQDKVKETVGLLEKATSLVNELQLFSKNEGIEEVATKEMKYLLLPVLLGSSTLKRMRPERQEVVDLARIYFRDFLKRLNDYQVVRVRVDPDSDEEGEDGVRMLSSEPTLESMARRRQQKVARYKRGKEMGEKLGDMKELMRKAGDSVDDEIERDYYMTLLRKWTDTVFDELDSINLERQVLKRSKDNAPGLPPKRAPKRNKEPLRPFIITKTSLQKKIYGLGYPSVPTMTVDEFVDKKFAEGTLAVTNKNIYSNSLQKWAEDPERKVEEDDEIAAEKEDWAEREDRDALMRDRQRDDWKDEHQRGEGNRKNMG